MRDELRTAEVGISGYNLERTDRANKVKKGGVALYLRQDDAHLFGSVVGESVSNTEYYCCYSRKLNMIIAVVYRPNESAGFEEVLNAIHSYVNEKGPPLPTVIVAGDFNFPQIN